MKFVNIEPPLLLEKKIVRTGDQTKIEKFQTTALL